MSKSRQFKDLHQAASSGVSNFVRSGEVITDRTLIMEAVRRGDGITYTARPFVDEEIRSGRLIELFSEPAFGIYHIRTRPGVLRRPVKIFIQWLKQQAAN